MGKNTGIECSDHTWNPWIGCRPVSTGCSKCYLFRDVVRYGHNPTVIRRAQPNTFKAPLRWHDPATVYVCSWSDFFIHRADSWRAEAWDIIRRTPHLTYQILTKRPERISWCLPSDWGRGYPNVWLGVSVENQLAVESRVPMLLATPAQLHFIAYEPALEPIDLSPYLSAQAKGERTLDWVMCGGESGPDARPMNMEWVQSVRDQCIQANVPFFLKQLGGEKSRRGWDEAVLDGQLWHDMPTYTVIEPAKPPEQLSLF